MADIKKVMGLDAPAGATKEFFVPVSAIGPTGAPIITYNYPVVKLETAAELAAMSFKCPHDFTALTSCKIIGIAIGPGTIDWTVATSFAAVGEAQNTHSGSATGDGLAMTNTEIEEIDISAAFTGLLAD